MEATTTSRPSPAPIGAETTACSCMSSDARSYPSTLCDGRSTAISEVASRNSVECSRARNSSSSTAAIPEGDFGSRAGPGGAPCRAQLAEMPRSSADSASWPRPMSLAAPAAAMIEASWPPSASPRAQWAPSDLRKMSTLLLMASARDSPTAARHSRRRRLASARADAAAQRRLPSGSGSAMAACAHISAQLSARRRVGLP